MSLAECIVTQLEGTENRFTKYTASWYKTSFGTFHTLVSTECDSDARTLADSWGLLLDSMMDKTMELLNARRKEAKRALTYHRIMLSLSDILEDMHFRQCPRTLFAIFLIDQYRQYATQVSALQQIPNMTTPYPL